MKTTDLMVGDWVLINDAPHKIQAIDSIDAEIQADDDLYYVGEDRCHSEDKIEGIPITPEILKKNDWYWGFTSDEKNFKSCVMGAFEPHWVYDKGEREISLYFDKDTDGGALRIADQRFNIRFMKIGFTYISPVILLKDFLCDGNALYFILRMTPILSDIV